MEKFINNLYLDSMWWIYVLIGIIIFVIVIIIIFNGKKKSLGDKIPMKNYNVPTQYFNKDELLNEKTFLEVDPDYSIQKYTLSLYKTFLKVQDDYMNMNILELKKETSTKLFDIYNDNLASLKTEGKKHMITNVNSVKSNILFIKLVDNKETVKMYLEVTCFDYILSIGSNFVTQGSRTNSIVLGMELTFSRDINNKVVLDKCPHCNNVISEDVDGICPICGGLVLSDSFNWVLEGREEVKKKYL